MIRVLQGWEEVGRSYQSLARSGLPRHQRAEKNWDLDQLRWLLAGVPPRAPILDMGCAGLFTLRYLSALGFRSLRGIDLRLTVGERTRAVRRALRRRTPRLQWRLRAGDLHDTGFPAASFAAISCVSVIEHGVDLARFAAEARRLLRPGGRLFVTTDYWEPALPVPADLRPGGLPWRIHDRTDIVSLIGHLEDAGLRLAAGDGRIPPCGDACVSYQGRDYTFLCLGLTTDEVAPTSGLDDDEALLGHLADRGTRALAGVP